MDVLATEFSIMSSHVVMDLRTCWHIPATKLAAFGSLLAYISFFITRITFSYPNSLFSHNSLSIVFGIRTWFSFQFKNATLTQNCEVHKSVRFKRYSIEEKKIVAQRKNKSNSNSFKSVISQISDFRQIS